MKLAQSIALASTLILLIRQDGFAYEINNHADIAETSANFSVLSNATSTGKLSKLGLRPLLLSSNKQRFPLDASLLPIPYCFGSERPEPFKVSTWSIPPQQRGSGIEQPDWSTAHSAGLTIAQLIRYGSCYEDEEVPDAKSVAHFYNPQNVGAGVDLGIGPSSLRWSLQPGAGTSKSGQNPYTWPDARNFFYLALTSGTRSTRQKNWALTFQSLGHVVHHLQDMASPQHVRNDTHCSSSEECNGFITGGILGLYKPSGYETFWESRDQYLHLRNLAQDAGSPVMFARPREFWNINTDDSLTTSNATAAMNANEGLAAYTATNFSSMGRNFSATLSTPFTTPHFMPAPGFPFPEPASALTTVPVANLPPVGANWDRVRDELCGGDLAKCTMRFIGTNIDANARTASVSVFAQNLLLNPANAHIASGYFSQNYFTYMDAASKLVPLATRYSAGLIDYFFRGELTISRTPEGVYGMIDAADPASNCKDQCGFRKIALKLTNNTAPINGVAQNMNNGTLVAIAKFSRNSCYTPDFAGDYGELNLYDSAKVIQCLYGGNTEPQEEIVVSDVMPSFSLAAGQSVNLTFNFATPIPINAWDIRLQIVFKGTLGAETGAVAVGTQALSAPFVYRIFNDLKWFAINGGLHTREQVNANPALLAEIPADCRLNNMIHPLCYRPADIQHSLLSANKARTLATTGWIAPERHVAMALLMDGGDDAQTVLAMYYPDYAMSLPLTVTGRSFHYDAGEATVYATPHDGFRGLHTTDYLTSYWYFNGATPTAVRNRPPLANPAPQPLDTLNF
ncbi:MAG: hypothetical protein IT523_09710 [Burkholderiales bacterium]|nr:hypothetical protein [Burkholderiales bacterium]